MSRVIFVIFGLNFTTKSLRKRVFFCRMNEKNVTRGRGGGTGQYYQMAHGGGAPNGGLKSVKKVARII